MARSEGYGGSNKEYNLFKLHFTILIHWLWICRHVEVGLLCHEKVMLTKVALFTDPCLDPFLALSARSRWQILQSVQAS